MNEVFSSERISWLRRFFISFGCLVLLLSIMKVLAFSLTSKNSDHEDYLDASYRIFGIHIPRNMNFAGEKVPANDFTVREAIMREMIVYISSSSRSLIMHRRANRWFPVIEPILEKNGIPGDFKYVALIESQLTNAVSPQGATGFWQLVEPTARGYGLEISAEVDERYDVAKSTEAACKYFREAYKQFGNWTIVAASYNRGITGIQIQLDKQKVDNYYDLELTQETARYVYRILAMKEIISRPKVYGYILRKKDVNSLIPTRKVTIDSTIQDLASFAAQNKINYRVLRLFNPWLRGNTLTVTSKKYIIELPKREIDLSNPTGNYDDGGEASVQDSAGIAAVPVAIPDTAAPSTGN